MISNSARINFVPDRNVLRMGESHFERPVDAMAEFVDNSIQACMRQKSCQIACHVFIQHHATTGLQSYLAFLDNGSGMDVAGIEKFATLALSQKDRGQAPEMGTETGKMFIGKFGVGAKQAGFYLGDRMTLFSKPQQQDVYRFVMEVPPESDSTTSASASASASAMTPFEGVVETLNLDALDQGSMLPLNETEKEPMCFPDMESVIKTHMKTCVNGSAIVIRLHEKIFKRFQNEIDLQNLSKSLKDIYHFHLHPNGLEATKSRVPVQIRLDWHQYSYYQPLDVISTSLGDEVIDFLDECRINDRVPFKVTIKSPLGSKSVAISGTFWYIPFENDKEQRPPLPTKLNVDSTASSSSDTGSQTVAIDNRCIVRCYWQNRLVPWTVLHNLALFDHVEKYIKDQKANVSEFWRRRIVGVLFLDWHFEDISNNKLKFNTSLTHLLNNKHNLSYTPISAVDFFAKWVVEQSKQDQELLFFDSSPTTLDENNNRMFNKLKFAGERLLIAGEKYQLPLSERSDHVTAVLVEGFVPDAMLYYNSDTYRGGGKILYQRLPEDLYGSKGRGRIPTSILYQKLALIQPVTTRIISDLNKLRPGSVAVSLFQTDGSIPKKIENHAITVVRGHVYSKLGVQIYQVNGKPTWRPPDLNHHYSVRVCLLDDQDNMVHDLGADNNLYSYDGTLGRDVETKPTTQQMAKQCYYSFRKFSITACGSYKLSVSVLNPDKKVIFTNNPIVITSCPPEIESIEIFCPTGLSANLGEAISPLKFRLFDKTGAKIEINEPISAQVTSEWFDIVFIHDGNAPSRKKQAAPNIASTTMVPLKFCPNVDHPFEMHCSGWKLVPIPSKLSSLNKQSLITGKEFSFSVQMTSSAYLRIPSATFSLTIFPGSPKSIALLTSIPIKLDGEAKSLQLVVYDEWGNRVAPKASSNETWQVKLLDGPLAIIDKKESITVREGGDIFFFNNLKTSEDYSADGTEAEQRILLTSSSGSNILETAFPITIIPSNIPTSMQIFRDNMVLDETAMIECRPEEVIRDLSYTVFDEIGEEISISDSAKMQVNCSWRNTKARRQGLNANGIIEDIQVPKEVGEYDIEVSVTIGFHPPVTNTLTVKVVADLPHRWVLEHRCDGRRTTVFPAGDICRELQDKILGASLEDRYGNKVSPDMLGHLNILQSQTSASASSTFGYAPVLEIFVSNQDEMEVDELSPAVIIPLVMSADETIQTKNKRKQQSIEDDTRKPLFVLPSGLSEDVFKDFHARQKLVLRITEADSILEASEGLSCAIGFGLPQKLMISTERYDLVNPVSEGMIDLHLNDRLSDIRLTVSDAFDNALDLKIFSSASLNVFANNDRSAPIHCIRESKAHTILSRKIEFLPQILANLIEEAIERKEDNGPARFALRFVMTLDRPNNAGQLTLPDAVLHCNVFLTNAVTGLSLELRDFPQSSISHEVLVGAGSKVPNLIIRLATENGQPFLPDSMDYFDLKMWKLQDGKAIPIDPHELYSRHVDVATLGEDHWIEIKGKQIELTDALIGFKIQVAYKEQRDIATDRRQHRAPNAEVTMKVCPGPPCQLSLEKLKSTTLALKTIVCLASDTSAIIGKNIIVHALDLHDNVISLENHHLIRCSIEPTLELSSPSGDGCFLLADGIQATSRGFSTIGLARNGPNEFAPIGQYRLCFSLHDIHQNSVLVENREFSFQLASSDAFTQEMQELQAAKAEHQHAIDEHKNWQQHLERLENQLQNQAQELQLISSSVGEPLSEDTLAQHKEFLDSELLRLENQKRSLIRPKIKKDFAKDESLHRLKLSDSKIIGRIVDLALIKDRKYINFASFLCQGIIDAVVTQDSVSAGQVYDANLKALPLDCVPPTMPLQFPAVCFPDPKDPEQFIEPKYIVDLFHFDADKEFLRETLFYDWFKDALVFEEFLQANEYRKYLAAQRQPCPVLYALDGRKVDGARDPNHGVRSLQLEYAFGEYFSGRERLNKVLTELDVLSNLRETMEKLFSIRIEIDRSTESAADAQNQINNLKLREQDLIQRYGI